MQIILKSTCGSLSKPKKKTLTYNIAHSAKTYYFRIANNSGGGYFSNQWICLDDALKLMSEDVFSATVLSPLFESTNTNNCLFIAASFVSENIIKPIKDSVRLHTLDDVAGFKKRMAGLVRKKVNLSDEVAERESQKEAARQA